ncbi:MAG: hypothetical protein R6V32_01010 [Bacteroidales bacterium]
MYKICLLYISLIYCVGISAQPLPDTCFYKPEQWPQIADTLHTSIPEFVHIDTTYAPAFYIALSHYPDLYETEILFKEKRLKTTAATRPAFWSVFKKPDNRCYYIFINNRKKEGKAVYYPSLPFNARIGLMGHELSHILDYSDLNTWEILGMGIKYVFSKNYRRDLEYHIDMQAIDHGLGCQIYSFSDYIFNQSNASPAYLKFKGKYYLQPEDILYYIDNDSLP